MAPQPGLANPSAPQKAPIQAAWIALNYNVVRCPRAALVRWHADMVTTATHERGEALTTNPPRLPPTVLPMRRGALAVCALFVATTTGASAEVIRPIGELVAEETAVVTKESGGSLTISDGTYTWFSGDRIDNRSGPSRLALDNGTSFGFQDATEATISVNDEITVVEIHRGAVVYASPDEHEVQIVSGEAFLTNRVTNPPVCILGPVGSAGEVTLMADGDSRVDVLAGTLFARIDAPDPSSDTPHDWYPLGQASTYTVQGRSKLLIDDGAFSSDASNASDASGDDDSGPVPLLACVLPGGPPGVGTASTAGAPSPRTGRDVFALADNRTPPARDEPDDGDVLIDQFIIAETIDDTPVVAFPDEAEPTTEDPVSP